LCLDYGGGHGVFVRIMRDFGFDFRWSDCYATNIYARGFEGDVHLRHELVTAFEVFEHLVDVRAELAALFEPRHRYILVSTLVVAESTQRYDAHLSPSPMHRP